MIKVIASGSTGNAVIYYSTILVDCGVPFSKIKPFLKGLQLVLISHCHKDHMNIRTIKKMAFEKPSLRFGIGEYLLPHFEGIKNIDILNYGVIYNYNLFKISPVKLYHDVPNFGYRIFKDNTKIFHATDTRTLSGITAEGYDLYSLEANYDEDKVYDIIIEKQNKGEFAHQKGSINSHLSIQQAQKFIIENAGENYKFITLHQSKEF